MKFGYTILYVENVPQSVAFYEQAFGLNLQFMGDGSQYAEMETGETVLAFAANEFGETNLPGGFQKNSLTNPPAGIEIGFVSHDVAAAFRRAVEAGAVAVTEPTLKPWGQTVSYVRDKDGVLIEICSPI